ncbi:related to UGA4-GABA permease-also involved in delta-aminolevulinate transport [Armillaria ostoyae]|uniref:Related to UGA4-GABA permease-also involved in delta-aminolevulinate transport n=1 Tax=Armillaria ostoyae TaxID=47428 RepID=A0A284S3Y2_ARMOS|nr:related to UGA4-GABA permease-also involved in delta-aminolevulinate transport [Armillaria ostoyae]
MSSDETVLADLGYRQEFKRDFSRFELFGLSFSIMGIVQSIASILFYSIPYGGPVSMVWGWLAGSVFIICIALAISELGSSAPTSGGLYYWTFMYSSPRYRKFLSWLIGYVNTIGYIAGVAAVDYSCAVAILTAATLGSDGTYEPTTAQIYGVFCALLASHALLASLATKVIARLQIVYVLLNIAVFFAIVIAIPAATPVELKNDAKYAFGHFENLSGYPDGFAFFMSFLAPLWTIGGFDTPVHISEEAKNARTAVPFAIMSATTLGCILGFVVNICLVLNMGTDLVSIIASPIGQPMATSRDQGHDCLLGVHNHDLVYGGNGPPSRQAFAFSRDGALPLSAFLYKMNSYTGTPANCVCVCAIIAAMLGLLSFAGSAAIGAIFTMGIACQYICYCTPVVARFLGGQSFTPGPFNLGRASGPVASVASVFMIFMIVVLFFPTTPGPVAQDMNYSSVVVGGTIILASMYYFVSGQFWFTGPVTTVQDECAEKRTSVGTSSQGSK